MAVSTNNRIRFRKRFLYKSHINLKRIGDEEYGCLFCQEMDSTARWGDATVFTSQDQLFSHLSRHQQPVPKVYGLTVLYGEPEPGETHTDEFDIHFLNPPVSDGVPEKVLDMAFPTAMAIKNHAGILAVKKLGTEPLQFLSGARIVGIEFPVAGDGKLLFGWHDGNFGVFPSKYVQLDIPQPEEIILQGNTNTGMTATARWKWDKKEAVGTGWLTLDKGEQIYNVNCKQPTQQYRQRDSPKG
jgi:hypothetical protein